MQRKITKDVLTRLKACKEAKRLVRPLLPITIDTDPEKNINVAIKIIHRYENTSSCDDPECGCRRRIIDDLDWLLYAFTNRAQTKMNRTRREDLWFLRDWISYRPEQAVLLAVVQILSFIAEP